MRPLKPSVLLSGMALKPLSRDERRCTKCGTGKPEHEFYKTGRPTTTWVVEHGELKNSRVRRSRSGACKACVRAQSKLDYEKRKAKK